MALGDYNNGDNTKKKYYEPDVTSIFGVSNTDGIDPSALSYRFTLGMLVVSISPMLPSAKPDDTRIWDHDNKVSIWLTHYKAKMLLDEIEYVQTHPDTVNNGGVDTRSGGLISFSTGKELGASGPCLIIRKIDQDTGEAVSTYAYQFKTDYYRSVRNYNPSAPSENELVNYPNLEVEEFKDLLRTYSSSIGGAQAYADMYYQRFDTNKMNTKVRLIMDKLGIEGPEYSKKSSGGNRSFFSNNAGSNSGNSIPSSNNNMRSTTMDALAEDMD